MENASKALIIAGAILLAILLISLGIMIFNQAQDTVDNSGMSQAEITAFNNKFLKYEGTQQKGTVVKSLVNEVISNNANSSNATVELKDKDNGNITTTSAIHTDKTYDVTLSYENGRVKTIKCSEN